MILIAHSNVIHRFKVFAVKNLFHSNKHLNLSRLRSLNYLIILKYQNIIVIISQSMDHQKTNPLLFIFIQWNRVKTLYIVYSTKHCVLKTGRYQQLSWWQKNRDFVFDRSHQWGKSIWLYRTWTWRWGYSTDEYRISCPRWSVRTSQRFKFEMSRNSTMYSFSNHKSIYRQYTMKIEQHQIFVQLQ